jgi:eukaryotic-like serine/threonine-protein kinase
MRMSAGVAARTDAARPGVAVLLAVAVIAGAFGAAFGIAKLTGGETEAGAVPQATPIEPRSDAPELPDVPPAAALPPLRPQPAPEPSGGGTAPPTEAPAPTPTPTPTPAPDGGGGGGGTIIEG